MKDLEICLPEEISKPKMKGLDGLRGVSILLVILAHVLRNYPVNRVANFFGEIGVYIFFVISGFLITTLLLKEKQKYGKVSLKYFYIRRSLRILPVVFLYLIILYILNTVFTLNISKTSFLTSFLFLKNFHISNDNDWWYTKHFWSLGIEEQFYLIFPLLFSLLSLRFFKWLILFLTIALPLLTYTYFSRLDIDIFHVNRFFHVLLGIIVNVFGKGTVLILIGSLFSVLLLTKSKLVELTSKTPLLSSFVLFIIGMIIHMQWFPWYIPYVSDAIFGVIIAMVIILNLKEQSFFGRVLEINFIKKSIKKYKMKYKIY